MKKSIQFLSVLSILFFNLWNPKQSFSQDQLNVLLPLYSYPTADNLMNIWTAVSDAQVNNPAVNITAIINPDSGPGPGAPNSDYCKGLHLLDSANVKMIGYVSTRYLNPGLYPRTCGNATVTQALPSPKKYFTVEQMKGEIAAMVNTIKCNIDIYLESFNPYNCDYALPKENYLNGLFFDEVAETVTCFLKDGTEETIDLLPYYNELYLYTKRKNNSYQIVLNPGKRIAESFVACGAGGNVKTAGDVVVTLEQCYTALEVNIGCNNSPGNFNPAPWQTGGNFSRDKFAVLLHSSPSDLLTIDRGITQAQNDNYGYLYFTDQNANWDQLPSYWDQFVNKLNELNTASPTFTEVNLFNSNIPAEISAGSKGGLYYIGIDNRGVKANTFVQTCYGWVNLSFPLDQMAVGTKRELWGTAAPNNNLYRFETAKGNPIAMNQRAREIAIGRNGAVFITDQNNQLHKYDADNNRWIDQQVSALKIAVDPAGRPWRTLVGSNEIVRFVGGTWVRVPGAATELAIGGDGSVYRIDPNDQLYQWNHQTSTWEDQNQTAEKVTVDLNGIPWIITEGKMYRRNK